MKQETKNGSDAYQADSIREPNFSSYLAKQVFSTVKSASLCFSNH